MKKLVRLAIHAPPRNEHQNHPSEGIAVSARSNKFVSVNVTIMNTQVQLLICLLIVTTHAISQSTSAVPENIRAAYSIDRFGDGIINEMIYGIPLPAPKVIGDTYIDEEWKKGAFLMYGNDKSIEGYEIRYDLDKQELEVRTSTGVKVVGGNQVKSFLTLDPDEAEPWIFINAREFKPDHGLRFNGFLQVLQDGNYALVSGYAIKVKRPDYNEAMNVGSRDYKIYKKEEMFFVRQGTLFRLPAKKKEFLSIFPEQAREQISTFMKSENLNSSEKADLMRIFSFHRKISEK